MNEPIRGVTKLVDHGSGADRWDLVVLGDGYQASELSQYVDDVKGIVASILATAPFDQLCRGINVYRVDVESAESGAGDLCTHERRLTFFNSNFCGRSIDRLLVANTNIVLRTALDAVPTMNATLLIVNSPKYGGSGGAAPVCSLAGGAFNIALHEMGHSHFGLADEYADSLEAGQDTFSGEEPVEPNVTSHIAPLKWTEIATHQVPLPTMSNPDCSGVDTRPSPVPFDTVGAFEGAYYHHCGIYRPQYDCKMRNVNAAFCPVCASTIRRVLQPFVPGRHRAVRS